MIHRVARSDDYRDAPTRVRHQWALRDLIEAHAVLDLVDAERARQEATHGR